MNDLTTPTPTGLSVPGRGFEGMKMDKSDLIIPRAKLLQALSPEVTEERFEGAKAGLIVNSLTLEKLPPRFVPIFTWKSYFRFNPRNRSDAGFVEGFEPGALVWRSLDPDDTRVIAETVFGPNGEKPLAMTCLNFFAHFAGVPMPVVLSFSKTSYKAGKQLLSLARFCGGDMWSRAYQLGTELQKNDQGTYFTLTVATLGASSEAEAAQGEAWWRGFSDKAQSLKVHEEEANDAESTAAPF